MEKRNVLVVPAWHPATFFLDPLPLLEPEFEFRVLVGQKKVVSYKNAIKNILTGAFRFFRHTETRQENNRHTHYVAFTYVKGLTRRGDSYQLNYLHKRLDAELNALFLDWKPELIHIQSISDVSIFVADWAKKKHIPVLLTEHLLYIRRSFDIFQQKKEAVYREVDKVICVSNYLYRNLITSSIQFQNVEVYGNFVNDCYIAETPAPKQSRAILFVATHGHDKDLPVLLETISYLLDMGERDFTVHVYGLDADSLFAGAAAHQEKLMGYLKLHSSIPKEALLKVYNQYTLLVSTSFSETFGLAIAEAILNGLPVVCTDSGGIHDFVNQSNGIIVPIRDARQLALAIRDTLSNLNRFDGPRNAARLIEKYGAVSYGRKMRQEYLQLIAAAVAV